MVVSIAGVGRLAGGGFDVASEGGGGIGSGRDGGGRGSGAGGDIFGEENWFGDILVWVGIGVFAPAIVAMVVEV